jgi:hypothetical protein
MAAKDYQRTVQIALRRHFRTVELEWSVVREATDAFAPDVRRYAPRVDVAIGPFNTAPGRDLDITDALLPDRLRAAFDGCQPNLNPRCLLAIEVTFSGSSKHIMGDILNASALGLFGIVLGDELAMPKIRRILRYLEALAQLEKLPRLFQNVVVLSTVEFDALLRD